jgi:CPA2 family monovalent cation:H+ antiporter-2
MGRLGSAVAEAFDTFGIRYVVIDRDPDVVRAVRGRGVPCLFGDAGQAGVLQAAGMGGAALVVVAVSDEQAGLAAVRAARAANPQVPIVARAPQPRSFDELRRRGATAIVQPELEAAATVIRHSLGALALPDRDASAYVARFRRAMESGDTAPGGALPEVAELTLGAGPFTSLSLRDARIRERFGVTVVMIQRLDGDVLVNPSPDSVLREGDRIRVFGLAEQVRSLRQAETDAV